MKLRVKGNSAVIKGLDLANRRIENTVKSNLKDWATNTERMAKTKAAKSGMEGLPESINANTGNEGFKWYVGSDLYEAPFVEFGTGAFVEIPAGLEKYAMTFYVNGKGTLPANAFLFNSAREEFFKMIQNLKNDLDKLK